MFHGHHRTEVHLFRVPAARGSGTRLEFRSPDSAANPYLALAVSLAAGLDGIKRKLTPGKGSMKNQYEMAEGEKQEAGINTLPRDMKEALEIFKQSTYMKELLGDHIFNKYVEAKSAEWESYQTVRITMGSRSLFIQDLMIDIYMIREVRSLVNVIVLFPKHRSRQKH